jgi:HSP20 family protein
MKIRDLVPFRKRNNISVRREDAHPVASLQHEMNRLFGDFWHGWGQWPFEDLPSLGSYSPSVDIAETPEHVEVTVELPGMNDKDVEITLSPRGDTLTLRGEKKEEREGKKKGAYWSERSYGSFCRTVALPAEVHDKNADASMTNGVLRVKLSKRTPEEGGRRRTEVKAS